jgi:hypothetical protein
MSCQKHICDQIRARNRSARIEPGHVLFLSRSSHDYVLFDRATPSRRIRLVGRKDHVHVSFLLLVADGACGGKPLAGRVYQFIAFDRTHNRHHGCDPSWFHPDLERRYCRFIPDRLHSNA